MVKQAYRLAAAAAARLAELEPLGLGQTLVILNLLCVYIMADMIT